MSECEECKGKCIGMKVCVMNGGMHTSNIVCMSGLYGCIIV